MHLAKFIDIAKGKGGHRHLSIIGDGKADALNPVFDKYTAGMRERLIATASQAEAFDFGPLHFEKVEDPTGGIGGKPMTFYRLPSLTVDEQEFFKHRLIPFPADICWFEWKFDTVSAILVDASMYYTDGLITATRIDFTDEKSDIPFCGIWATQTLARMDKLSVSCPIPGLIASIANKYGEQWVQRMFGDSPRIAMYFALMLASRTTEIKLVKTNSESKRLSRMRGLTPLPDHRVVTIIPQRFRNEAEQKNGEHQHKRLHWRRSHIRHYDRQTPSSVWAEHIEHEGKQGWYVVTIPRFLVGRREDGEVTHEYRFATNAPRWNKTATDESVHVELLET